MTYQIIHSDCLDALKVMPDNSIDSIVTDPPYGLKFMGKKWDCDVPTIEIWIECLRVLKPGGHLLAFAGTRTQHRMAVRIEDAGFEIRDMIAWVYGSGFPKSKNLSEDWQGWGTALKPSIEPITVARKPFNCSIVENVNLHRTGALNIDGCRVSTEDQIPSTLHNNIKGGSYNSNTADKERTTAYEQNVLGRWPANLIHDGSEEVLNAFPDAQGAICKVSSTAPTANGFSGSVNYSGMIKRADSLDIRIESDKSAARFFYCAKASRLDRNDGLPDPGTQFKHGSTLRDAENLGSDRKGNHHPTVKPTELMRYLVRLVTPPNGTVLDPFLGSGSTGKAAILEDFNFIGIERELEYVEIAIERCKFAYHKQPDLFGGAA